MTQRPCHRFLIASCMLCVVLAATVVATGCVSGRRTPDAPESGLHYRLMELQDPRPNRVHILRVNLAERGLHPEVILGPDPDGPGPAEASLTDPRELAKDSGVLAYVNTNPWSALPDANGERNRSWYEGQPVDIHGLAVSQNQVRSRLDDDEAVVWINALDRACVGQTPDQGNSVAEAMEGFQPVVTDGVLSAPQRKARHPRTAIGLNREGTVMWWVVVDGRQEGFSEGMTLIELGELMLELGCWDAVNMDGGGSSILALRDSQGRLQIRNSPSDRRLGVVRIRPLPSILTIKAHP